MVAFAYAIDGLGIYISDIGGGIPLLDECGYFIFIHNSENVIYSL